MLKQLLPTLILVVGVIASVALIQNSTLLKSKANYLIDFIPAFYATENESRFNSNLDVYKDGIINVFDVLKDRYLHDATRSATMSATPSATQTATPSASLSPSLTPSPTSTPSPSPIWAP